MWKIGIPDVMVRSVMSLHEGAKTRVLVDSVLSEEFALVVDVVIEFASDGTLCT